MTNRAAGVVTASLLALGLSGCVDLDVQPQNEVAREHARDHADVTAVMRPAEPPPPLAMEAANDAVQAVKYTVVWGVTAIPTIPIVLAQEALVWALIPVSMFGIHGPQDQVDDAAYYAYHEGGSLRRIWNTTPGILGPEEDLVERDRREGIPAPARVPASAYPFVETLRPPGWDESPRQMPGPR